MPGSGLVLTGDDFSTADSRLIRVAQFFGVQLDSVALKDVKTCETVSRSDLGKTRLLCRADVLLGFVEEFDERRDRDGWKSSVHSVFVYADSDFKAVGKLVRILTGSQVRQAGADSQRDS